MDKISNPQPVCNKKGRLIRKAIEVKPSKIQGCGVFADQTIFPGEIIEECPIVLTSFNPAVMYHAFKWDKDVACLPLGYGAIYNHSKQCNAKYVADKDNRLLKIIANKIIYRGDEILISYGDAWFKDRNLQDFTDPCATPQWGRPQQNPTNWPRVAKIVILSLILAFSYFFTPTVSKSRVHSYPGATSAPQQQYLRH